jgi:hypothetical protein
VIGLYTLTCFEWMIDVKSRWSASCCCYRRYLQNNQQDLPFKKVEMYQYWNIPWHKHATKNWEYDKLMSGCRLSV